MTTILPSSRIGPEALTELGEYAAPALGGDLITETKAMDGKTIAAMVTTLLGFMGGMAVGWGFTADQWVAIGGGVAAIVAWVIDVKLGKKV